MGGAGRGAGSAGACVNGSLAGWCGRRWRPYNVRWAGMAGAGSPEGSGVAASDSCRSRAGAGGGVEVSAAVSIRSAGAATGSTGMAITAGGRIVSGVVSTGFAPDFRVVFAVLAGFTAFTALARALAFAAGFAGFDGFEALAGSVGAGFCLLTGLAALAAVFALGFALVARAFGLEAERVDDDFVGLLTG